MKLTLVTKNPHKFNEIRKIMAEYGIELLQHRAEKLEGLTASIEDTAIRNAESFAKRLNRPVIVDDSGIEFEVYPGFPGPNPKWVFETLGYKGIMRLLYGKTRKAIFNCAAAYCEPGQKAKLRVGHMKGRISEGVQARGKDVMPYERIFIPVGQKDVLANVSRELKNRISHRARAFRLIGEMLR